MSDSFPSDDILPEDPLADENGEIDEEVLFPGITEARESLEGEFKKGLGRLLAGASLDVERFAREISADLAFAAFAQDDDVLEHLRAQMRALAEKHRLAASEQAWSFVGTLIDVAAGSLGIGLAAGARRLGS
ncbi:MAG: hypothetical protein GY716_16140 [bacterium]|nr:hypothetical protein [bacterium]